MYFLSVTLTPILASATAHIWDSVAYGYLHGLYTEIHTAFFWLFETVLFHLIGGLLRKKGVLVTERTKDKWQPVSRKNLWILTGIVTACILVLSIVVGFQVKIFYDFGEKVTGYDIWCTVGRLGCNVFKCMWITALLLCGLRMADEINKAYSITEKPWFRYLVGGAFLMLFGIFDVLVSVLAYPVTLRGGFVALVYFLFYAVFPLVHYYAEESKGKTYLIIVFIYLL